MIPTLRRHSNPSPDLSLLLYPAFLDRLRLLSGITVAFQTNATLQSLPEHMSQPEDELAAADLARLLPNLTPGHHRFVLLDEHSLDPRELAVALRASIHATTVDLRPNTQVLQPALSTTPSKSTPKQASSAQDNS